MPQVSFWIWLSIVVIATIVELSTLDMTSIWFAFSGIVALILSAFKSVHWVIQLIVFVVLSAGLIIGLRPIARKIFLRHMNEKTNAASIIGKKVYMLTSASFGQLGSVKISDVVWSAIPEDETETIEAGMIVEVKAISGNKLIVKVVDLSDENK